MEIQGTAWFIMAILKNKDARFSPTAEPYRRLIGEASLFNGVRLEGITYLLEDCAFKQLMKGETLLAPNRKNDNLYVLLSGGLSVHLGSPESAPLLKLGGGECVGEISIITEATPSAYVVADENSVLLVIKQKTLWAMVRVSHGVARNLLYIIARRLQQDNQVIRDSIELLEQYELYASTDALTGLYNRRRFDELFERLHERYAFDGRNLTLLLVDVDHFKNYNDTHGHAAGDRALFSLARVLTEHVRPDAVVARYGGEEFLVVLPETDLEQGRRIAQRLVDEVNKMRFTLPDNVTSSGITVSIGLAQANPDGAAGDVYAAADAALRRAREKGRNCVAT
ncbi:MAG: GGDEF domain-containing protein [Gammaproteobacteria bacterium]|nr:MAG: GGDEF domain-containing protein [Gammaproteobacteria bacterium]